MAKGLMHAQAAVFHMPLLLDEFTGWTLRSGATMGAIVGETLDSAGKVFARK